MAAVVMLGVLVGTGMGTAMMELVVVVVTTAVLDAVTAGGDAGGGSGGAGDDKGTHLGNSPCQLMKVQAQVTKDFPHVALSGSVRESSALASLFSVSGPSRTIICRKWGSVQCVTWHLVRKDALHRGTGGERLCRGTAYHARCTIS